MAGRVFDSISRLAEGIQHSADGLIPIDSLDGAWVTHYGESFNGQTLGCDTGLYSSDDASIVAVGPSHDAEWPCGTVLRICGPGGCLVAQRADACPGCGAYHVDLSEKGLLLVCGPGSGVCQARVEAYALACRVPAPRGAAPRDGAIQLFATLAESALQDRTADLLDLTQDQQRGEVCTARASDAAPLAQP